MVTVVQEVGVAPSAGLMAKTLAAERRDAVPMTDELVGKVEATAEA